MPNYRLRTINRKQIEQAEVELEALVNTAVQAELNRLWRDVQSKVRRINRLRPKMQKVDIMAGTDLWEMFSTRLQDRLMKELLAGAITIHQLLMASFTATPYELDTDLVAKALHDNLGLMIKGVTKAIKRKVGRKIVGWYNSPATPLQTILDQLKPLFGLDRAKLIARTIITRLDSLVKGRVASDLGITEWWWMSMRDSLVCKHKLTGPDGKEYAGCRALHGKHFQAGMPMPPDGSHPACRCSAILVTASAKPFIEGKPIVDTSHLDKVDFKEDEHPRDEGGKFTSGAGGGSKVTVMSGKQDILNFLASRFEKKYGWDREHTREKFMENQAGNVSEARPEFVERVARSLQGLKQYQEKYNLEPLPAVVRGMTQGENDKWVDGEYSDGFVCIIDQKVDKFQVSPFSKKRSTVGATLDDVPIAVYLHEYGHHIEQNDVGVSRRARVIEAEMDENPEFKDWIKNNISVYATANSRELAAECFALAVHPEYDTVSDETKKFVEELLGDKMPRPAKNGDEIAKADFKEQEHPRDTGGKFTDKGKGVTGGGKAGGVKSKPKVFSKEEQENYYFHRSFRGKTDELLGSGYIREGMDNFSPQPYRGLHGYGNKPILLFAAKKELLSDFHSTFTMNVASNNEDLDLKDVRIIVFDPKTEEMFDVTEAYESGIKTEEGLLELVAKKPEPHTPHSPPHAKAFKGEMVNPQGRDTKEQYSVSHGKYTPERQALHSQIVERHFEGKTKVEQPVSIIFGGGSASGKSTLRQSGMLGFPENMVVIDPDLIKEQIPEYQEALEAGDYRGASWVHEESNHIAKLINIQSASTGYNTLLDGTGDSSYANLKKKVEAMRALGQPVHGVYVTASVDAALKRNQLRAELTGRKVPKAVIRYTHKAVSKLFPQIVENGLMDTVRLYDVNEAEPVLIASSEGNKLVVHDQEKYQVFLEKAKA